MTRTMYDSVTATDIPVGATMVAGYVNGTFRWSDADWARFPHAVKVRIATRAYVNDGHVLDVEPGDAKPTEAPGWVQMRRAAGVDPTVYCNTSTLGAVQAAFTAAGVAQPHYWLAHYDNVASVPPGAVAKQYIDAPSSGGHYDLSAVADYWPGVDSTPAPGGGSPAIFQGEDEDMQRVDCAAIQTGGYTELDLAGSDQARITIYPGPEGVWVDHIFWWGEGHVPGTSNTGGLGNDPAAAHGGQSFFVPGITTFTCKSALLAGVAFSAATDFHIVARG